MSSKRQFRVKRIYTIASDEDGCRVLVDRLWPRGVSKEEANIDVWAKQIAPSTELRTWFGHDRDRFAEFSKKYRNELDANSDALQLLDDIDERTITLLYAANDTECNHAVVLRDYLSEKQQSSS